MLSRNGGSLLKHVAKVSGGWPQWPWAARLWGVTARWLTFFTAMTTVLGRSHFTEGRCIGSMAHKGSSLTNLLIVGGKTPHGSECSDYRSRKIPLQKEDSKSPVQLKGQNFLHLRDSPMNKPVKHGLDLLNMKTTGLKYNLARKERKCTEEAK